MHQIIQNNSSVSSKTKYPVEPESVSILKSWSKRYFSKYKKDIPSNASKVQSLTKDIISRSSSQRNREKVNVLLQDTSKNLSENNDLDESQFAWLIQPLPWMKSKSNFKTFREGSLPKSLNAFKSYVSIQANRYNKKSESRNKRTILFPNQAKTSTVPKFSVLSKTYNLTTAAKNDRDNQRLIQCKRRKYKQQI